MHILYGIKQCHKYMVFTLGFVNFKAWKLFRNTLDSVLSNIEQVFFFFFSLPKLSLCFNITSNFSLHHWMHIEQEKFEAKFKCQEASFALKPEIVKLKVQCVPRTTDSAFIPDTQVCTSKWHDCKVRMLLYFNIFIDEFPLLVTWCVSQLAVLARLCFVLWNIVIT